MKSLPFAILLCLASSAFSQTQEEKLAAIRERFAKAKRAAYEKAIAERDARYEAYEKRVKAEMPVLEEDGSCKSVIAFVDSRLKDPYSAVWGGWGKPFRSDDGKWAIDFVLNAKNSYGGYVGEKRYTAYFSEGRVYRVTDFD